MNWPLILSIAALALALPSIGERRTAGQVWRWFGKFVLFGVAPGNCEHHEAYQGDGA